MNNGYIKLYRTTLENPAVMKDAAHLALWALLLMLATHTERKEWFNGKVITLQPGQFITGRKFLAKKLRVNEHKVDRILKTFKNEHQIKQEPTPQNRLITIINWPKYQNSEQQSEQRVSNKRATSEQRVSTYKKVKKVKNEKKYTRAFENFWTTYPRKVSKGKAFAVWESNELENKAEEIATFVKNAKKRTNWQEIQYIPHPTTFLNQERWTDDLAAYGDLIKSNNLDDYA